MDNRQIKIAGNLVWFVIERGREREKLCSILSKARENWVWAMSKQTRSEECMCAGLYLRRILLCLSEVYMGALNVRQHDKMVNRLLKASWTICLTRRMVWMLFITLTHFLLAEFKFPFDNFRCISPLSPQTCHPFFSCATSPLLFSAGTMGRNGRKRMSTIS